MKQWISDIQRILDLGQPVVLATVWSQTGSTPRAAGTRMVVDSNGQILGTIGGGMIEAAIIEAARGMLTARQAVLQTFDMTSEMTDGLDMICGGSMEVLVEPIAPDSEGLLTFSNLFQAVKMRRKGLLVTELQPSGAEAWTVKRTLIDQDESVTDTLDLAENLNADIAAILTRPRNPIVREADGRRFLIEPLVGPATVYLFGAGHVSLQVARLAKIVDFHTVVLDDRHEFANRERFAGADDIQVLSSFEEACGDLDIDADSCLVILTRGHLHDKTVLRQALGTRAGYIGMIGSRRKRDLIYAALRAEGFSAGDLNKVHCPIGLAIGAQTPEEIAVSIVAELIRFRANRQPDV